MPRSDSWTRSSQRRFTRPGSPSRGVGDGVTGRASRSQMVYDLRRRLVSTQTFRSKPSWWGGDGGTSGERSPCELPCTRERGSRAAAYFGVAQRDLRRGGQPGPDCRDPSPLGAAEWDRMGCGRTASEWPAGSKPVTKRMTYDDAYRVTRVEYLNPNGASATAGTATTHT